MDHGVFSGVKFLSWYLRLGHVLFAGITGCEATGKVAGSLGWVGAGRVRLVGAVERGQFPESEDPVGLFPERFGCRVSV